ncbi:unnamed protein product [Dovyalis caffra]|uniref:Uncharacterized protein n=1 Tax=Dovyalis caffra TaxID=77055 RepID=A0AAV1SQA1_9ROSI|nr:unnamed protein product [Dovyalis caffra]
MINCNSTGRDYAYVMGSPFRKKNRKFSGYPCASGFAFYPETKDYKLFMVFGRSFLKAEVFPLRTGAWKQFNLVNPFGECFLSPDSSVVAKGIWYHVAFTKAIKDETMSKNQIKSAFDIVSEAFSKIEVGRPYDDIRKKKTSLMVYKEGLTMSVYNGTKHQPESLIYMENEERVLDKDIDQ